jgi:hypothetical protein
MAPVTVTPAELELLSELAALERRARRRRARRLSGRPPLRSAVGGGVLLLASAALVVTWSFLAPRPGDLRAVPTAQEQPSPPVPIRSRPVATPRDRPLPAFVWVPIRRATAYEFRLARSGTVVFSARTSRPRLELPRRWTVGGAAHRLGPGVYRWDVRPLFGRRRGRITVRARLSVAG